MRTETLFSELSSTILYRSQNALPGTGPPFTRERFLTINSGSFQCSQEEKIPLCKLNI